jgi:hypothetical protein
MTISGYISLEYKGVICESKKYSSKTQRNVIISKWIKDRNLENKKYILIISPIEELCGKITLYVDGEFLESKEYKSWIEREKILSEWNKLYSNRDIYFEILPI